MLCKVLPSCGQKHASSQVLPCWPHQMLSTVSGNCGEIGTVCQFTCGSGVSLRTRQIKRTAEDGGSCDGNWKEERPCTSGECPVDCTWNDWSDWESCSQTCGRGISLSTRDSKGAEFGGQACVGDSQRQVDCNVDPCPVDCAWSDWSDLVFLYKLWSLFEASAPTSV